MNIKDIAREAKVSIATVSRCFDPAKKELVHPETRQKVDDVAQKHGYAPNRAARAFRMGVHETVGMVTPLSADIVRSPYYVQIIAGIIEGIRPLRYDLKWITVRDEEKQDVTIRHLLDRYLVDGLVIIHWQMMPKVVEEVRQTTLWPVVLLNSYQPNVRSSILYCENKSGVREVCLYLKKKGYRKLGMLQGPAICVDAVERFQAFQACAKSLGYSLGKNSFQSCEGYSEVSGYHCMMQWIRRGDLPDAIYCANDDLAVGAMKALFEKKVKIPERVALVGHDDTRGEGNCKIALTTVRQPLESMGRAAIEALDQLLAGIQKKPIRLKFKPELVVRDSA